MRSTAKPWKLLHRIVHLESPWITVYADKLLDDKNQELEYWHFDRADSVVVIAVQQGDFLLPAPQYRPGVGETTLDFAGGRIPEGETAERAAYNLLARELSMSKADVLEMQPITPWPLAVDSSFSSQKLHGMVAKIADDAPVRDDALRYPLTDVDRLRQDLRCAQCRVLLNEYLLGRK